MFSYAADEPQNQWYSYVNHQVKEGDEKRASKRIRDPDIMWTIEYVSQANHRDDAADPLPICKAGPFGQPVT